MIPPDRRLLRPTGLFEKVFYFFAGLEVRCKACLQARSLLFQPLILGPIVLLVFGGLLTAVVSAIVGLEGWRRVWWFVLVPAVIPLGLGVVAILLVCLLSSALGKVGMRLVCAWRTCPYCGRRAGVNAIYWPRSGVGWESAEQTAPPAGESTPGPVSTS
jgi:hypothetical protein